MTDIPKYGEVDETDAARRQKALQTTTCLCPGDPSASAAGWNPLCPQHGNEAHRHPWLRDAAQPEPGSECPDQNHVGHCQCHLGGPVLMGADVELYDCCRAPAGGDHDDDCPDHPADPPTVDTVTPLVKTMVEIPAPEVPTLGDLAEYMRAWRSVGVSGESVQYAASKVWEELPPLTLADVPPVTRVKVTGDYAADILTTASALVNGQRNADYGDARDNFTETAGLWQIVLGPLLRDDAVITAEQVALCMNQLKVARLIHNTGHADSWIDGCGYLALGGGIAHQTQADDRA